MTTRELFEALAIALPEAAENIFHRLDLCIFSTRVALDVCDHFGVEAHEMAVRVVAYNQQFSVHVESGAVANMTADELLVDGSYAVGLGFGKPNLDTTRFWAGHLIAVGPDCLGDFSIRQAERVERGIIIGPSVVMEYEGQRKWWLANEHGTVLEYTQIDDRRYLRSPDWRDEKRRSKLVGALIRAVRESARMPRAAH
jgi:hypothetical protein